MKKWELTLSLPHFRSIILCDLMPTDLLYTLIMTLCQWSTHRIYYILQKDGPKNSCGLDLSKTTWRSSLRCNMTTVGITMAVTLWSNIHSHDHFHDHGKTWLTWPWSAKVSKVEYCNYHGQNYVFLIVHHMIYYGPSCSWKTLLTRVNHGHKLHLKLLYINQ